MISKIAVLCLMLSSCSFYESENDVLITDAESTEKIIGSVPNIVYGLEDFPPRASLPDILNGFREAISETEQLMIMHGLVDIQELEPSIAVELKYSTSDNFLGKNVYGGMQRAYLQPEVAKMLIASQHYLQKIRPGYSLIVYDAARPRSVQQLMWDSVDAPFEEKVRFLSNTRNGSVHNFGAAVDVSVLDPEGIALDMGTPFDYMGPLAYPSMETEMLQEGLLTRQQIENRQLLRHVMRHGGFWGIQSEWWHFNAFSRAEARERFEIIE